MTWSGIPVCGAGGDVGIEGRSTSFAREYLDGFVYLAGFIAALSAWAGVMLPQMDGLTALDALCVLLIGGMLAMAGIIIASFMLFKWWTEWRGMGVLRA